MPPQVYLWLCLAVTIPAAWLCSEFQHRIWLRLLLGILSLAICVSISLVVGLLQQLNDNA